MAKKQNFDYDESTEEKVEQEQKPEEPKKFQNEGKKLFSTKKEGGTRVS